MNTTENNKIIAEFMNWLDTGNKGLQWNWLMEVVEKIEDLKSPYDGFSWSIEPFTVVIKRNYVYIEVDAGKSEDISFPDMHCKSKIEMVYNTCLEFIKWYNEQKAAGKATSAKD